METACLKYFGLSVDFRGYDEQRFGKTLSLTAQALDDAVTRFRNRARPATPAR